MASSIDDITINYEEEGVQVVKELEKEVLTRGSWTTIMFRYQDWNRKNEGYGVPKFSIRRYRKRGDDYIQQSKFTISSADQARKIIVVLEKWIKDAPVPAIEAAEEHEQG